MAYQSDLTKFLNDLKAHRPTLEKQQLEGRSLLWDKTLDLDALDEFNKSRVAQKPYVYQTK
jgi:Protein of unknown function (DUF3460)